MIDEFERSDYNVQAWKSAGDLIEVIDAGVITAELVRDVLSEMTEPSLPEKAQPTEAPVIYGELGSLASPRAHMRIQVTKNTKGYSYETSVSVDADDLRDVRDSVKQLLIDADTIARQEIERRELLDGSVAS